MLNYKIPIFPLNGCIFFPETNLPLNIFEPRYLEMIDFALASEKKIGMVQLKEDGSLYQIGCLGKINSYDQTDDGRYIVNLIGLNYFSVTKEIKNKNSFRTAEVEILKDIKKNNLKITSDKIKRLLNLYFDFMKEKNDGVSLNFLKKIEGSLLIKFIAMTSPFTNPEKQMLLETFNLNDLVEKLSTLIELYLRQEKEFLTIN